MREIGDQIKHLRKSQGMTQERLADLLGVSGQSVSKWENHLTAPDISLLPAIANVFHVSIDELFGYNLRETDQAVMDVCRASWEYRETDRLKSREILDEGLRRFPGNEILLNNYLYTLDREAEADEIIRIATSLADTAQEEDVRLDALTFLAQAYARKGEYAFAKATVERIPEIYFTKLSVAAQVLRGEEKYKAANAQKWICLELMVDMMRELAIYYADQGQADKAQAEKERGRQLVDLFSQDKEWVKELLIELE